MQSPKAFHHVIPRPGDKTGRYFVPDPEKKAYWSDFYKWLVEASCIVHPLNVAGYPINTYFGQFGFRFHPISFQPLYFHIGIDFDTAFGTPVYAVADGKFQYSGIARQNGLYTLLSHPQVVTADHFVLNSLYLHLESVQFSFRPYEKILRMLGSIKFTDKVIKAGELIGTTGDSGNSKGIFPHLHFQLEFRHVSVNKIIVVSPSECLGYSQTDNLTKDIESLEAFRKFYKQHEIDLANWEKVINP